MAEPPLVSIITPSYNQAAYLAATIQSVLDQDYPAIEYIVIDGASTDGSVDVIRKYAPRLAYWISEPDGGQAAAINKGFARARGDILAWINSDDTYLPGGVGRQVQALLDNPTVGLVYGDAQYIDEVGRPLGKYHARPFDRRRFLHVSAIPQPTVFFRRALYDRCGGLDERLHYALDYAYFLRLMWEAPFLYTHQPVATYRMHNSSKTVSMYERMAEEAVEAVRENCDKHPAVLRGVKNRATSDWYWLAAMQGLEYGDWRQVRRFATAAIKVMPFRPRSGMFGLKLVDHFFSTKLSEAVTSWMDRRARTSPDRASP